MIFKHSFLWYTGAFTVFSISLLGCNAAAPPVAETPPPPVSVSQPLVRDVIDQDDYEGHIKAVDMVDVRARVRGHLVKINFQDGQIVKKDDPLFEIDPR